VWTCEVGQGQCNGYVDYGEERKRTHRVVKVNFSVVELGLEHERSGVRLLRQALDDHVQWVCARDAIHRVHNVHGHYRAKHVVRVGHRGRGDGPVTYHSDRVSRPADQPADDAWQPVRVGGQGLPLMLVVVIGGCWRGCWRHGRGSLTMLHGRGRMDSGSTSDRAAEVRSTRITRQHWPRPRARLWRRRRRDCVRARV